MVYSLQYITNVVCTNMWLCVCSQCLPSCWFSYSHYGQCTYNSFRIRLRLARIRLACTVISAVGNQLLWSDNSPSYSWLTAENHSACQSNSCQSKSNSKAVVSTLPIVQGVVTPIALYSQLRPRSNCLTARKGPWPFDCTDFAALTPWLWVAPSD